MNRHLVGACVLTLANIALYTVIAVLAAVAIVGNAP